MRVCDNLFCGLHTHMFLHIQKCARIAVSMAPVTPSAKFVTVMTSARVEMTKVAANQVSSKSLSQATVIYILGRDFSQSEGFIPQCIN